MIRKIPFLLFVPGMLILQADQVILKNGDRVTGKIISSDAKTLILKTEAMGEVKIDRAAVSAFRSDGPLNVTLKDARVVGAVHTEEDNLLVTKEDAVIKKAAIEDVVAVREDAAQKAWDREQLRLENPPLFDFWTGNLSLNLATASGNARTVTFGTGALAQRATGHDKIVLNYTQIYSRQSTVAPFGATANRVSGAARYDRNLSDKFLTFGLASFDFDQFQDLDLRRVLGGGFGYHAFKDSAHFLDLGGGFSWNHEKFGTGLIRNSGEILISEESAHQLTAGLKLFQRGVVFPNLSETGQYRLNWDGGISLALTRLLSWNINLSDRYLSNPLPERKKNDVLITTGIGFNFAQK
jgi:putative salt-induced outer membrane protein